MQSGLLFIPTFSLWLFVVGPCGCVRQTSLIMCILMHESVGKKQTTVALRGFDIDVYVFLLSVPHPKSVVYMNFYMRTGIVKECFLVS